MNILHSGRGEVKAEAESKKVQKRSKKLLTSEIKSVILKTVKESKPPRPGSHEGRKEEYAESNQSLLHP
jgi:hypothetical protein